MNLLHRLVCEDAFFYKRVVFLNTECSSTPYFSYTLPPRDSPWKTIVYDFASTKLKTQEDNTEWDWDIFKTNILEPCLEKIYAPNRSFAFFFEEVEQMKSITQRLIQEYNFFSCETVGMVLDMKNFSPKFVPLLENEYFLESHSLRLRIHRCTTRQDLLVYHRVNWMAWKESEEELANHLVPYSTAMNLEQTTTVLGQEYPIFSYFVAFDEETKQPVACSALCYHFETNSCFLFGVGTIPQYQKKGLGSLLTQVCLEEAKQKYSGLIRHCTMTAMPSGTSIYSKMGFTAVNTVMYLTHFGERRKLA